MEPIPDAVQIAGVSGRWTPDTPRRKARSGRGHSSRRRASSRRRPRSWPGGRNSIRWPRRNGRDHLTAKRRPLFIAQLLVEVPGMRSAPRTASLHTPPLRLLHRHHHGRQRIGERHKVVAGGRCLAHQSPGSIRRNAPAHPPFKRRGQNRGLASQRILIRINLLQRRFAPCRYSATQLGIGMQRCPQGQDHKK